MKNFGAETTTALSRQKSGWKGERKFGKQISYTSLEKDWLNYISISILITFSGNGKIWDTIMYRFISGQENQVSYSHWSKYFIVMMGSSSHCNFFISALTKSLWSQGFLKKELSVSVSKEVKVCSFLLKESQKKWKCVQGILGVYEGPILLKRI